MAAEMNWGLNVVRWSDEHVNASRREAWRVWRGGRALPAAATDKGPTPQNGDPAVTPVREVPSVETPQEPVLWHQVGRGEDWSGLVARYNIVDPEALLAANGLSDAGPLVPGEWICVPCRLVRPVWEIDPGGEGEGVSRE